MTTTVVNSQEFNEHYRTGEHIAQVRYHDDKRPYNSYMFTPFLGEIKIDDRLSETQKLTLLILLGNVYEKYVEYLRLNKKPIGA